MAWSVRCLLLGLCLGIGLATGSAKAQSLQDALISAYQTNPQLAAERARQRATDEDVARAWGGLRPSVSANASKGLAEDKIVYPYAASNGPKLVRTPSDQSVQLRQEVWDGNRTFADVRHAKLAVENGRQVLISMEQTVLGAALQAYYDLYRDQHILKIQEDYVRALKEQRKATEARYRVKDVTQTDLAQAEARLAGGLADAQQFSADVESSKSAFLRAIGFAPGEQLTEPPAVANAMLPSSLEDALAAANTNPELLAAIYAEKAAQADIEIAEAALLPDLSVQASTSRGYHADTNMDRSFDSTVVLALTVPLYDGGVASARTRGAKHTAGQRRLDIEVTRNQVIDQVKRSWQNLQAARARIKSYEENAKASQVALTGVQQELRVGSRTVLDELNARQELLVAQVSLLRARHDAAIAAYSLLAGCGHLTANELNLPLELYDATAHFESVRSLPWGPWIDTNYPSSPEMPAPDQAIVR